MVWFAAFFLDLRAVAAVFLRTAVFFVCVVARVLFRVIAASVLALRRLGLRETQPASGNCGTSIEATEGCVEE